MEDIFKELVEIRDIIRNASFIELIRKETSAIKTGTIVTDGKHHELGKGYDIVVSSGNNIGAISRRLRGSFPSSNIEQISDTIIGINKRRGEKCQTR